MSKSSKYESEFWLKVFFKSRFKSKPELIYQSRSQFLWKNTKTVICARYVKKNFKLFEIIFSHHVRISPMDHSFEPWIRQDLTSSQRWWRVETPQFLKRNCLFDFLLLSLHFTDQRLSIRGKSVCRKFWWVKSDYYDTTVLTPCRFSLSIESVFSSLNRFWWNVAEN